MAKEKGYKQALARFAKIPEDYPDSAFASKAQYKKALVYEKIGLRRKARGHWRRYLQLEPSGTWVEIARQRLED